VTVAVTWSIFFVVLRGKAFCERPFALHRQQPEHDKQNVDNAPPRKISAYAYADIVLMICIAV